MPERTGEEQDGRGPPDDGLPADIDDTGRVAGRFGKGRSGNPAGRPKGSRNRSTLLCQDLLDGDGQLIVAKCISMAKEGHAVALRLCIERIVPPRLDRLVDFRLPKVHRAEDVAGAMAAVIDGAARGALTLEEAGQFTRLLERQRVILETADLAIRLEVLEEAGRKETRGKR